MFEQSRRQRSAWSYRVPLWGCVLAVAALVYLDASPMVLEPDVSESGGEAITRADTSDVVAVVDYRAIQQSDATFRGRDWSAAWVDMLQQHLGSTSVVTPSSLTSEHLDAARIVILTASVSSRIPAPMRSKLRQFVLQGNLLVVERPDGELRDMFSANGEAGIQTGRNVTFARGIGDPFQSQLTDMPVETEYVGSTSPKDNAETLLAIDGAPVVYRVPVGDGHVVTIDFDLGQQLVALQQGRPAEDFTVATGEQSDPSLPPKTRSLVADEAMTGNDVPYADLLERFIVHGALQQKAPVPGLWPFPGEALGTVIPIHPDRTLGDGGGWMLEYETDQGATSTLLSSVDAGLTASGSAVVDRRGGEIGLLWRMPGTPSQHPEAYGFLGFEPVARPLSLERQLAALTDTIPSGRITTTRSTGTWWSDEWARPFRRLAGQGVALDVSYTPDRAGFAFGTGFPYRALDRTGLPLSVREMPVTVPDRRSDGLSLEPLLEASRNGHHQVVTYEIAPASFGAYPDMQRFSDWVESFKAVRRYGHVIRNAAQFHRFWTGRLDSSLESRIIEDAKLPTGDGTTATTDDTDGGGKSASSDGEALLMRISASIARNDISITVPGTIGDREFAQARRRPSRAAGQLITKKMPAERQSIVGYDLRRIPVDAGSTRIDVYYR